MENVIRREMCKKFKFDHTNKWVMHNLENDILLWDFDIQTDHLISARRPDLIIINKKKKTRICKIVDFVVQVDHRTKLKECEKKHKYLVLARELKKLWNMKVTFITIVTGAFGTVTKGLLKLVDEWTSSKLQHYWERPEYWEKSWRLEETCCHWHSNERPSPNADVKNSNE